MNLQEYNKTINQLSGILILKYFNGNRNKSKISISQLMVKFEKKDYDNFTVRQPISAVYFRNNFQYLCQKKPDLVSSIVYLNSDESKYLVNDLNTVSHSGKIIWREIPSIKTLAAAEQIFQKAKQKVKQLLNQEKPLKKDTSEVLNLIEPLSGSSPYNDIQQIYWMLYCELRFTLQLLKSDKDFDLTFGFDREWLDLRKGDVPLLDLLCNTNLDKYKESTFRKNTVIKLKEIYNNYKVPDQQSKQPSIVSDSALKIQMIPKPERDSNNVIIINNKSFDKVHNYTFDFLYYLLWLRKNCPNENASIKRDDVIPTKYINEMLENDKQIDRFQFTWNTKNHTDIKQSKSRTVNKINKDIMKKVFSLSFKVIVTDGDYYKLSNAFKSGNIDLGSYRKYIR